MNFMKNVDNMEGVFKEEIPQLYSITDYVIMSKLGRGSYGRVYLAKNMQTKYLCAIKKLNIEEGIPTSTLREIALLKVLQHPNIISFHHVIITERIIYMVIEYLKMNLDEFIKEHEISSNLFQSFMYQLLQGTLFIHNRRILHRDIKPRNILVHHNMTIVKLSDFGLARHILYNPRPLTPTVVTLFYRSPELLLTPGKYFIGIDIWALACVFVEMVIKQPLFRVEGEIYLFHSWFSQLGLPTAKDLPKLSEKFDLSTFTVDNSSTNYIMQMKGLVDPLCYNLIMEMFIYNPNKRIDGAEALHHQFFKNFDKSVVPAVGEEDVGYIFDGLLDCELDRANKL